MNWHRIYAFLLILIFITCAQFVQANNTSLVFLSCNQDVFEAGDSIELFARVFNAETEDPVPHSDLFVMVKSLNGDIVCDARFGVENGLTYAQLKLPEWLSNGFYTLVAFTRDAYEKNNVRQLGIQHFYVFDRRKPTLQLNIQTSNKLEVGNTIVVKLELNSIGDKYKLDNIDVELNDYNGLLNQTSIRVIENQAQFVLELPSKYKKGLYLTFHNRNYNLIYKPYLLPNIKKDCSIVFYPEGGKILTNSNQKIIYRCFDNLNRNVKLDGRIEDENGILVGEAQMLQAGLGRIETKPVTNDSYYFVPNSGSAYHHQYALPRAENDGVVITFHAIKNGEIELRIFATGAYLKEDVDLIIRSKGKVVYSKSLQLDSENLQSVSSYSLPRGNLKAEIVSDGRVLSERLIYNQQPFLHGMELENHFEVEKKNDSIAVKIISGLMNQYFSVASYDLRIVPSSSHVFNNLLGTNSYLQKTMLKTYPGNVLEMVLANIELIGNCLIADAKSSEINGTQTVGFVVDRKGNKIAKANVIGINIFSGRILKTLSDANGEFRMVDIIKEEITWKAFKDGRELEVELEHDFETSLNDFLKTSIFSEMHELNLNKVLSLASSEVNASVINLENGSTNEYKNDLLELIKLIKPFYIRNNQIVFENERASFIQSGALFVINDRPMGTNIDILNSINPAKVLSVNIYSKLKDIERFTSLNSIGVINIKTSESQELKEISVTRPYEQPYWFRNLELKENSLEVKIPSRDLNGSYNVIVDAVLENGQRIRTTKSYNF